MLTKAQKESRVIELYEQNKNYREIAQQVHMSLSDISSIIKRHTGEEKQQIQANGEKQRQQKTIDTKALELFEAGRTPVQVTIDLDIKTGDVIRLHKEWWQLKGLSKLNQLYEEIGDEIFPIVNLYEHTRNAGIGSGQVVSALRTVERLPTVEKQLQTIINDVYTLEDRNERAEDISRDLSNQITTAKETLDSFGKSINLRVEEVVNLNSKKAQLESFITRLKSNSQEYCRVVSLAREELHQILSDKRVMLHAALLSVLEALKEDPEKQVLIYDSLDNPLYTVPPIPFGIEPRQYRQLCLTKCQELAEQFFEKLIKSCVNRAIATAASVELHHQPELHF
jgi:hypothetical protein